MSELHRNFTIDPFELPAPTEIPEHMAMLLVQFDADIRAAIEVKLRATECLRNVLRALELIQSRRDRGELFT